MGISCGFRFSYAFDGMEKKDFSCQLFGDFSWHIANMSIEGSELDNHHVPQLR